MRRHGRLLCHALTLVELVMSLAVTASIGVVTTTVVVSMMSCKEAVEAEYDLSWSSNIGLSKLEAIVGDSLLVLNSTEDSITLWTHDSVHSGRVDLSEIAAIRYDSSSQMLLLERVAYSQEISAEDLAALDQHFSVGDAITMVSSGLDFSINVDVSTSVLAVNLQSITFTVDDDAPDTNRLEIEAVFGNTDRSITLTGTAYMRCPVTDYVIYDSGIENYLLIAAYDEFAASK